MKKYGNNTLVNTIIECKWTYVIIFFLIYSLFWFELEFSLFKIVKCLLFTFAVFSLGGIFCYFLLLSDYFWINQRQFIYSLFKNDEIIIWILDSFMAPETIFFEFWHFPEYLEPKAFICRICIYFLASICYKLTLFLMGIFFVSLYISAFYHFLKYFSHPYRNSFPFETLPYSVKCRFFELQTPSTRYRFTKAYPNVSMLPYYNSLYVDNLLVATEFNINPSLYEISQTMTSSYNNFKNIANGLSEIQLMINQNMLKRLKINLSVLNYLQLYNFTSNDINKLLFLSINLSKLKNLEIWNTSMDYKDLMKLKKLKNLESICLWLDNDGTEYLEKAKQILEATVNIPMLKFCYKDGIIKEKDNFEVFLVEWVLTHGYFKSFICQAHLGEHGQEVKYKSELCENYY